MKYCERQILVWLYSSISLFATAQAPLEKDSTLEINSITDSIIQAGKDTSLILIADISVYGNKKTKPFIIERELPFKQGDYMRRNELEKKLKIASQQVMNTALFTQVFV